MAYFADYKVVDGMTFVRGKTPKGEVISYGRTSTIALNNLMNKYSSRNGEREIFRLGDVTTDPIERNVAVRRNKNTEWWFNLREKKGSVGLSQPVADEEPKDDSEYIYEVENGVLKVYKLTLERVYKVKPLPAKKDFHNPFDFGGKEKQYPQGMPGYPQVMLNSDKGDVDVA